MNSYQIDAGCQRARYANLNRRGRRRSASSKPEALLRGQKPGNKMQIDLQPPLALQRPPRRTKADLLCPEEIKTFEVNRDFYTEAAKSEK